MRNSRIAVDYKKEVGHVNDPTLEYIVKITHEGQFDSIAEFKKQYPDSHLMIQCEPDVDPETTTVKLIEYLTNLEDRKNLTLSMDLMQHCYIYGVEDEHIEMPKDLKWMVDLSIKTYADLYSAIGRKQNVFRITGELGFALDRVRTLVGEDAEIRVDLTYLSERSQFNIFVNSKEEFYKTFFIQPKDLPLYSLYVDVFEIRITNPTTEHVTLSAYKRAKWSGMLSEIIPDIELNDLILNDRWGHKRMTCELDCVKGGTCRRCPKYIELHNAVQGTGKVLLAREKPNQDVINLNTEIEDATEKEIEQELKEI